jgi:16S rRNA (cytosine967-C5)-methyltransferase
MNAKTTQRKPDARRLAIAILLLIFTDRLTLTQALSDREADLQALSPRDRGFTRMLVATVLRRRGQIDDAIKKCLAKPLDRRAARVRPILQVAVAQLLFLNIAPHAAINEAVTAAGRYPQYKGLVNAVLRRISREKDELLASQDDIRLNCPTWLWQVWCKQWGEQICRAVIAAQLQEAPLDISVKGDPADWAARLGAEILPSGSLRLEAGGRIEDLAGYEAGEWWVQDAAAAQPVRLLGEVAGKRVLDLCAAPGGKTAQLAAAGALVTAVDVSGHRLERLSQNLKRLNLKATVIEADAMTWTPEAPFELVLLDAPCSATGTLRRHPDIWRLRRPDDIKRLTAIQDQLLARLPEFLAPGGQAIYCTCSLQDAEGPARIAKFLAETAEFVRQPFAEPMPADPAMTTTADGDFRTMPQQISGGQDGFYIARLAWK